MYICIYIFIHIYVTYKLIPLCRVIYWSNLVVRWSWETSAKFGSGVCVCVCLYVCLCVCSCVCMWMFVFMCIYASFLDRCTLQNTATHCNTLQHTATNCNMLQYTATNCNTLWHTVTHCNTLHHTTLYCNILQHTATHRNIALQHTATRSTRCNMLKHVLCDKHCVCACWQPLPSVAVCCRMLWCVALCFECSIVLKCVL